MDEKKSSEKKSTPVRARNFTALVYPDCKDTPENWFEVLAEQQLTFFVSPLHDKDITPTGEPKKPHYHVILMFDSMKTKEQAKEVFQTVGAVIPPKVGQRDMFIVASLKAASRYLIHLDNPDKASYKLEEVRVIGDANYEEICNVSADKYSIIKEMIEFCKSQDINEYYVLLEYSMDNSYGWYKVLCDSGTYVMKEYLKSRRNAKYNKQLLDKETGEVIIEDIKELDVDYTEDLGIDKKDFLWYYERAV